MSKVKDVVVVHPEKKLDSRLAAVQREVAKVKVIDQPSYDLAGSMLLKIKAAMTEVEEALDPQVKATYSAWQVALGQKKKYLAPYQGMERILKDEMGHYDLIEERKREEEERKLREEAERLEVKERAKLQKKVDKARAKGDEEKAEELEDQMHSVMVPQPQVVSQVTKVEGVSKTKDFDVEIVDMLTFIQAIAAGEIKINVDVLFSIKSSVLKAYINATGAKALAGCKIIPKMKISAKRS